MCLGSGAPALAFGALVLFLSNMLSLVLAGTFVFAVLGYVRVPATASRRRAMLGLGALGVLVTVPLLLSTAANYVFASWEDRIRGVAAEWLATQPGATVLGVRRESATFHIAVRSPTDLPPTDRLLDDLRGVVPDGLPIVVEATRGRMISIGRVGS